MSEIFDFDPTDANNTARWPEGMAFSAVNDAGRADEGILARWYEDSDFSRVSSGSANAYAVISRRTIPALFDNLVQAWSANFTNTGACTLNLNGLGSKSVKRFNGSDLTAGDIISGLPVLTVYKTATDTWYMVSAAAALFANMHADFNENAAPGDPAANVARVYAVDVGGATHLAWRDSTGAVTLLRTATQATMETPTLDRIVKADIQHFHPGHPKAWGRVQSDGTLDSGDFNVASVVRNSQGIYTVTLTTAMGDTGYAVVGSAFGSANVRVFYLASITSESVFVVNIRDHNFAVQDSAFSFLVLGDH